MTNKEKIQLLKAELPNPCCLEDYYKELLNKLGGIKKMLEENRELALKLAKKTLANAELDILSSTIGLRFLCRAELLNKNYSLQKTTDFLKLSMGTTQKAERQAKHLFNTYEKIKEE